MVVINTLYEIVRRAQEDEGRVEGRGGLARDTSSRALLSHAPSAHDPTPPSPSSTALFAAYENVLADQGLQPSDDAVLHRFLFRMQEDRRDGEDLVMRFRRVLGDVGITIEIVDGEVTANLDRTRNGAVAALGRHSRRGSFDSFFDRTADKVAGTQHGDLALRVRSGGRRARSDTEALSYQVRPPRMNGYRSTSGQRQPTHGRTASVSSIGSLKIRRDGRTGTSRVVDYDADDSEHTDRTTSLDLSHVQVPGINAPIPSFESDPPQHQRYVPEPYRPSDTRLLDEAETFEEQRLHRVTRECIQAWRDRTHERMSIREDMEKLATAFDRRILLKASFELLRDTARIQRSNRETDRFFHRLEERADKARSIFLLTKAFTHWAKSAEDEVQRTSVARRHILRTRFFNGWRDITAVNELKIQHFVLAKFLRQWRARAAAVRESGQYAVLLYEENLVRRVYRDWFFKFCNIAAPAWHNERMRKVTLQKMNEITRLLKERQAWATERYERGLVRKMFTHWRQGAVTVRALEPQADGFRQTALVSSALQTLRKQAQLAPLLRQFQQRVDGRLVRSAFQTWRHTAQLSRQARTVDHMRVLRNAWTAWNDRLRIKALQDRINDRVMVECLYRWTLASRVSLFKRVQDRALKESTFLAWVTKTNERSNTLDAAERRFAQFKRAQLLRTCLCKMEVITTERRREEFAVVAEYQQKLKQRIFDKLKERQEHFLQLNKWAGDGRFYVLSKRTLKTWSEATQHARRNRRRDTYAQFRRTVKSNLIRRLFVNWREKANHIAHLAQQANDVLENRTLQNGSSLLHQWHDRTLVLSEQDAQASHLYASKLQTRTLHTWIDRLSRLQTLDLQAVALRQESTELVATSALKKLGWRLWNIQRQEENARALYDRNFEKHVKAMLRFWTEQMRERVGEQVVSPTPTSQSRRHDDDDDDDDGDGDDTRGLEAWTALDADALGLNNDLNLELSITPERRQPSSRQPMPQRSILRPTPARPHTFPQQSSLAQQTIPEDSILDPAFATDIDRDLADAETFWTGTPMPPPSARPGYLKTPSKRSVVRAKRLELPASPEKRGVGLVERERLGAMSAPPAPSSRFATEGAKRGVTSFETRLREGGFGNTNAAGSGGFSASVRGRGGGKGKPRARVGFELN
jgi:protein SFI1